MRDGTDPYQVLGVARDATSSDIHDAWRRLCVIYHPDRFAESQRSAREEAAHRMALANEAYAEVRVRGPSNPNPDVGSAEAASSAEAFHEGAAAPDPTS